MKSHSTVRRSLSVDHVDLVLLAAPHPLTDVHTLPPAFFELWEVSFHHLIAHSFRDFLCCNLRAQQRALASAMSLQSNLKASSPILRYFPVRAFLRLVFDRPSCFDKLMTRPPLQRCRLHSMRTHAVRPPRFATNARSDFFAQADFPARAQADVQALRQVVATHGIRIGTHNDTAGLSVVSTAPLFPWLHNPYPNFNRA